MQLLFRHEYKTLTGPNCWSLCNGIGKSAYSQTYVTWRFLSMDTIIIAWVSSTIHTVYAVLWHRAESYFRFLELQNNSPIDDLARFKFSNSRWIIPRKFSISCSINTILNFVFFLNSSYLRVQYSNSSSAFYSSINLLSECLVSLYAALHAFQQGVTKYIQNTNKSVICSALIYSFIRYSSCI